MRKITIAAIFSAGLACLSAETAATEAAGRFSVRGSIEMVRFSDPSIHNPTVAADLSTSAKRSPDGRHFAVVTTRGLIESNEVESTLWVFAAADLERYLRAGESATPPAPRPITRLKAIPRGRVYDSYAPAISDVRWLADSQALFFLGLDATGVRRLYRVAATGDEARALTPEEQNVVQFSFAGGTLAYAWQPETPVTALPGQRINDSASAITGMALMDILFPGLRQLPRPAELWVTRESSATPVLDPATSSPLKLPDESFLDFVAISPDGRRLVVLLPAREIPAAWEAYQTMHAFLKFRAGKVRDKDKRMFVRASRYAMVDLDTGRVSAMLDAPNGWSGGSGGANKAVWSPSGKLVLLMNTYLPLEGVDSGERERRLRPCAAAIVRVATLQVECLVSTRYWIGQEKGMLPAHAAFGRSDDELTLQFSWWQDRETQEYLRRSGRWRLIRTTTSDAPAGSDRSASKGGPPSLAVTLKQDLNTPPALWVTDGTSQQSRRLWDPNPQLAAMDLGEASVYRWKSAVGHEWTAGLVKPPDYTPGKRYPLVIQTHGFDEKEFITDGAYTTAFAVRPLAAAGFVVLQLPDRREDKVSLREATNHVAGYVSVIDALDAEGLIDPERVGLIGFSRTCWHVETALIEAPDRFAAATIVDGVDESYIQYMLFSEAWGEQREQETIYGTPPFGDGLKNWTAAAAGFRLHRVRTPLRIEAITLGAVLAEWEIYASLRMQKKPVDLILIPDGEHILQKPLERLASQGGNVDWFRFWLLGEEDPDPAKAEQYKRWRELRSAN